MLRFAPLREGVIFSGTFRLGTSPSDTLNLELAHVRDELVLTFMAEGKKQEDRQPLIISEPEGFITTAVNFQLEKGQFYAGLGLTGEFVPEKGIRLSGVLNGDGTFRLGTENPITAPQTNQVLYTAAYNALSPEEQDAARENAASKGTGPVAVIDELALTYATEPALVAPENPESTEAQADPEEADTQEEDPQDAEGISSGLAEESGEEDPDAEGAPKPAEEAAGDETGENAAETSDAALAAADVLPAFTPPVEDETADPGVPPAPSADSGGEEPLYPEAPSGE
jgi:hypothetical protein